MKIAAMESMWHTEPAPASFTLFGIPDRERRETRYAVRVPWMLGLIATRSIGEEIPASSTSSRAARSASGAASPPMTRCSA